jgi:phosphate-selective porin
VIVACALWSTGAAAQQITTTPPAAPPAPRVRFTFRNGPSLRFGKAARIDFRVALQADARSSDAPFKTGESDWEFTRKRVGIDGEVTGYLGFQVEGELGSPDPWRDVYANYQQFDAVQVQAGKFKLPFCLDENTSYRNLDFIYRSSAAIALAPGRDRGVMVHGRVIGRRLEYFAGVFDHDGTNARRPGTTRVYGGQTLAARFIARPFRSSKSVARTLEIGGAFVDSEVPLGLSSIKGETALGREFYEPDFLVLGPQRRQGFELRWRPGPFSVRSEYLRLTTARQNQSVEGTDLPSLLAEGWYVSGTWAVTGERKADGLDRPLKPVTRGGPGAIEFAARIEGLDFSSTAGDGVQSTSPRAYAVLGNHLDAFTFGVNWFPMRWVKVQFNVMREWLAHPDQGPLPAESAFWSRVLRVQFAW